MVRFVVPVVIGLVLLCAWLRQRQQTRIWQRAYWQQNTHYIERLNGQTVAPDRRLR